MAYTAYADLNDLATYLVVNVEDLDSDSQRLLNRANELVKQITDNTEEQNKTYTLVVQYPFHKVTYSVIVDTGGMSTNINTITTFKVFTKSFGSVGASSERFTVGI